MPEALIPVEEKILEFYDDELVAVHFDDGSIYVPLRRLCDNLGLDWKDWRDYIHFNRNIEKEKELYYNVLGLKDDDEFVYVNRLWCTRPKLEFFPHIPADSQSYGGYKSIIT